MAPSSDTPPATHHRPSVGAAVMTTPIVGPVHVEPGPRAVTVVAGSLRLTLVHRAAEALAADLSAAVVAGGRP